MKKIVLCADDYGQSASISAGILQLVQQGRLSAVSCLSEGEFWPRRENTLFDHRDRIDIGLHFNLTHPFPNTAIATQSLSRVLRVALSGNCDYAAIAKALHAQLDRFEAVAGQQPDFVDGHQHVHVLPGIRNVVVTELARRYTRNKPYLRAVNPRLPGHGGVVKLAVLKLLGSGFDKLAQRCGLQTNSGFAGIYALTPQEDFTALMRAWISDARSGDLLMCHPGLAGNSVLDSGTSSDSDTHSDPIAATRPLEFAWLQSAEFGALLQHNDVQLTRFRHL